MKKKFKILFLVFGLFWLNVLLIVAGGLLKFGVGFLMFALFLILLPLYILVSRDALGALIIGIQPTLKLRVLVWLAASLPTLIFGLLGLIIGISIIGWVLYNLLIEMQPEYIGSAIFAGFGIAPLLVFFGIDALISLFVSSKSLIGQETTDIS